MESEVKPNIKELVGILKNLAEHVDKLPQHAIYEPVRQYEWQQLTLLLHAILDQMVNPTSEDSSTDPLENHSDQ